MEGTWIMNNSKIVHIIIVVKSKLDRLIRLEKVDRSISASLVHRSDAHLVKDRFNWLVS